MYFSYPEAGTNNRPPPLPILILAPPPRGGLRQPVAKRMRRRLVNRMKRKEPSTAEVAAQNKVGRSAGTRSTKHSSTTGGGGGGGGGDDEDDEGNESSFAVTFIVNIVHRQGSQQVNPARLAAAVALEAVLALLRLADAEVANPCEFIVIDHTSPPAGSGPEYNEGQHLDLSELRE